MLHALYWRTCTCMHMHVMSLKLNYIAKCYSLDMPNSFAFMKTVYVRYLDTCFVIKITCISLAYTYVRWCHNYRPYNLDCN